MGVLTLVKIADSGVVEYLRILYKINDIYSRYEIDDVDLLDEIEYYYAKKDYSVEEINELQNKCVIEWKTVLISLCNNLKTKIESKTFYTKLLKSELKQVNKIKIELHNEKKALDEYDDLFDNRLLNLRNEIEREIAKEENQNKKLEELKKELKEQKKKYTFYVAIFSTILFIVGILVQKFVL